MLPRSLHAGENENRNQEKSSPNIKVHEEHEDDMIRTRMKSTRQRNPNLKVPGGTVGGCA